MKGIARDNEYKQWLLTLKSTIKSSQLKAAVAVNSQLILMYWELGKMIVEKQESSKWGSKLIAQIAVDLKKDMPGISGFSRTNLYNMRQFYLFYRKCQIVHQAVGQIDTKKTGDKKSIDNQQNTIVHQVGGQSWNDSLLVKIPWRHHIAIVNKCHNEGQAVFYIQKTIENNWSRAVLEYQIETNLFGRQGKAINNFENTLPQPNSDLAKELLKNPYNFEFLSLSENLKEKELEKGLVENITEFLLELGKGFAYMGKQFSLKIANKEYRTDLLFYHTKLKAYIVIELKVMNFNQNSSEN